MQKEIISQSDQREARSFIGKTIALLKNPATLLIIVMCLGIGFRIYKMHYAGIVADEAWTYRDFCADLNTAVTRYDSTNNHLLNSILIVLTKKVIAGYEHFIRIPSTLFGIMFCVAVTGIVNKTIRSQALKVVLLLLILFNWFIVDLTILARGYAIALGVTFAAIALLMKYLQDNTSHKKNLPVVLLIAMNFFAFGSMLSSLSIILSINAVYFGITILTSIKQGRKPLINAISRMFAVAFGSAASLYLLYRHVFSMVIKHSKGFEVEPFRSYLSKVLFEPMIYIDFSCIEFNKLIYKASITLLVICAAICVLVLLYRLTKKRSLSLTSPANIIFLITGLLLLLMFLQNNIFKMSLGLPRNSVFLLPLILISSGIIIDRAACSLSRIKPLAILLNSACIASMAILFYLNIPATHAINVRPYDWGKQSSVGPLVRKLRQVDPDKKWRIKLTRPYVAALEKSIVYYKKSGHNIKEVNKNFDVLIVPEHTLQSNYIYLMPDLFKDHHCAVIINPASFEGKMSLIK